MSTSVSENDLLLGARWTVLCTKAVPVAMRLHKLFSAKDQTWTKAHQQSARNDLRLTNSGCTNSASERLSEWFVVVSRRI